MHARMHIILFAGKSNVLILLSLSVILRAPYLMIIFLLSDEARQSGGKVLIHCQAGVSRSATITIAYILKHTRMTMIDTYKYVKGKRSIISPNFNFMGQLMEYERELNVGNSPRILQPKLHGIESSV